MTANPVLDTPVLDVEDHVARHAFDNATYHTSDRATDHSTRGHVNADGDGDDCDDESDDDDDFIAHALGLSFIPWGTQLGRTKLQILVKYNKDL